MRTRAACLLFLLGCGSATPDANGKVADPATPIALARPAGLLEERDAERYAVALVNRDRKAHDLAPVVWDETAAVAGRKHALDMAKHGFTAHWGTDGDVPEERYTAAGGADIVMENVGCYADAVERLLDDHPRYDPKAVEAIEEAFMNEVPPNDGHRKNILAKWHTSMGVGLAMAKGLDVPCMSQEIVDDYGDYDALPRRAKAGKILHVAGEAHGPAEIAGVGFARLDPDKKRKAVELMKTHSYPIPAPFVSFFPHGYKTPIELGLDPAKKKFAIDAPLSDGGRPGLYEVSVWGTFPGSKELVMISLRTIEVD